MQVLDAHLGFASPAWSYPCSSSYESMVESVNVVGCQVAVMEGDKVLGKLEIDSDDVSLSKQSPYPDTVARKAFGDTDLSNAV